MLVCETNLFAPFPLKVASKYQAEILTLAINNYGHLIKTVVRSETSLSEFADKIAAVYDTVDNLQNKEVIWVLRQLHTLNTDQQLVS